MIYTYTIHPCLQLNRFIRIMRRSLAGQLFTLWLLLRWLRSSRFPLLACTLRTFCRLATSAFPFLGPFGLYTFQRTVHFRLQVVRVDRFRLLCPRCAGRLGRGRLWCFWWFWRGVCFE